MKDFTIFRYIWYLILVSGIYFFLLPPLAKPVGRYKNTLIHSRQICATEQGLVSKFLSQS